MQANEPPDSSIQCFTDRLLFGGYIPVAGEADREFLVANTAALFVFPLTAYSLYEFFAKGKRANATILRLLLTLCILLYYLWDFAVHSNGGIDVVILCPLLLFLLMGLFIGSLVGKRKEPGK